MRLIPIRFCRCYDHNYVARNPLIVQYLSRLGYMRDFGIGIPRVLRLMREHNGTEPEFELIGEEFVVRLQQLIDESNRRRTMTGTA